MIEGISKIAKVRQPSVRLAFCGGILLFFSIFVNIGWLLHIPFMVQFLPGMKAAVFNATVCFFLIGLFFLTYNFTSQTSLAWRLFVCFSVILIAGLNLLENLAGYDLGIDNLILKHLLAEPFADPYLPLGRMTSMSALGFILSGIVGLLLPYGHQRIVGLAVQLGSFLISLIAFFGLLTCSLNIKYSMHDYTFMQHLSIPFYSAICLMCISIGWGIILKQSTWYRLFYRAKAYQLALFRTFAILLYLVMAVDFFALALLMPLVNPADLVRLFLIILVSTLLFVCSSFIFLYLQVGPLVRKMIISAEEIAKSKQRLQQSEERYLTALKGHTAAWQWDIQKNTAFFSPHFKHLLGYEVDEFPGTIESFEKSLHPADHDRVIKIIQSHCARPASFKTDFRLRTKDGEYRWFDGIAQVSCDSQGQPLMMEGSITDITEHKRVQQRLAMQYAVTQALTNSHDLHEASLKILPAICEPLSLAFGAVWVEDASKEFVRCLGTWSSPAEGMPEFEKQTRSLHFYRGCSLPGRIVKTGMATWIFDVCQDDNLARQEVAIKANLHTAFGFPIMLEGETFGVLEFFTHERVLMEEPLLQMMADIGPLVGHFIKRKQAENELRQSEELKGAILESATDSIMRLNEQGDILSFNSSTCKMFGYSAAEMLGKGIEELVPGLVQELTNNKFNVASQFTGIKKDRENFAIEVNLSRLGLEGQPMFVCIIRDITERKKIEEMKNEFITMVSHELRTPLTSIKGAISLLLERDNLDASDSKKLLDIAYKNCERLIRLINDILDVEKIEAGKMDFKFERVNLKDLLQETVKANSQFADKFKVHFKIEQIINAPILGDYDRLTQVVTNLLSNAAKFSHENGQISISLVPFDHKFRVIIRDYGAGLPLEFQPKIFGKFVQVDSSTVRGVSGTGLGLNICKAIIDKHQGHLGFISKEGEGSTFYFDLPDIEDDRQKTDSAPQLITKPRILVCADDDIEVTNLCLPLANEGWTVDTTKSISEARQLLIMHKYEAFILDMHMSGQGTLELLQEMRVNTGLGRIPLILLSNSDTHVAYLENNPIECMGRLTKPYQETQLRKILSKAKYSSLHKPRILSIEDESDGMPPAWKNACERDAEIFVANSVAAAKKLLEQYNYDLILLDWKLEDGLGTELLPYIDWKSKGLTPIIVLSTYALDEAFAKYVYTSLIKSETSDELLVGLIKSVIKDAATTD